MSNRLFIVGSGGLASEVANIVDRHFMHRINFEGFLDEDIKKCGKNCIHFLNSIKLTCGDCVIIAIGDPKTKERLKNKICVNDVRLETIIDSAAIVQKDTVIGDGSIIFPGVIFTANNIVGKCCTIYQHSSISHDTIVGDFCNITPGVNIAGRCKIGNRVYLGIGCSISNDISICDDAIVGAGAVVVKNITEPGTYVGVPARRIK